MKISKTHHVTKRGHIKRNLRIVSWTKFNKEFQKEQLEHPALSKETIEQIVKDHLLVKGRHMPRMM